MAHLIRVKMKDGGLVGLDPLRAAVKVEAGLAEYHDDISDEAHITALRVARADQSIETAVAPPVETTEAPEVGPKIDKKSKSESKSKAESKVKKKGWK